jgi:hypothetical protein
LRLGRFCGAQDGIKRHLAIASDKQPRPVIILALLEDDTVAAYGVVRYSEQLDSGVTSRDPGDAGVSVHLKHGIADVQGLTVTMRDIAHRARFGTECFSRSLCVKLIKL